MLWANIILIITVVIYFINTRIKKSSMFNELKWQISCSFLVILALMINGFIYYSLGDIPFFIVYCFVILSQVLIIIPRVNKLRILMVSTR